MRYLLTLSLLLFTFGCTEEDPYPHYYAVFNDGSHYQAWPRYTSEDCVGSLSFRMNVLNTVLRKSEYEKYLLQRCDSSTNCYEYKKCKTLTEMEK